MKHEFIVVPLDGTDIKSQSFMSVAEQAQTPYDLDKVSQKLPLTKEIKPLIDNETGLKIVQELAQAHENGHISRSNYIAEQGSKILGMAEPTNAPTLDYRAAMKARNDKYLITEDLYFVDESKPKTPKPDAPSPQRNRR